MLCTFCFSSQNFNHWLRQLRYWNGTDAKMHTQTLLLVFTAIRSSFVREFFCSPTIHLRVKEPSGLVLSFVPFEMQKRYCVIILSNRKVRTKLCCVLSPWLGPLREWLVTGTEFGGWGFWKCAQIKLWWCLYNPEYTKKILNCLLWMGKFYHIGFLSQ